MFDLPFIIQSPLALLGLLTLLIPLSIHLLSKARPRVIAFAHIALITVKTSPLLRQLRLTQLVLLCLRLLMLLLATLILAQLYWQPTHPKASSHILLTEDWLNHATDSDKQKLIVQANDVDLVLISTKNRNISQSELTQWPANHSLPPAINLWAKVADYLSQLSANETITVYTTNRLNQFIGARVGLTEQVKWHIDMIAVDSVTAEYSSNIQVIYDGASEALIVYLRAAFEVINTHNKLNLNVDYMQLDKRRNDSRHSPLYDHTIDLRPQNLSPNNRPDDVSYITQAELRNIHQADFVLTLARLVFSSQNQAWWLENTRLSREQITQFVAKDNDHLVRSSNKNPFTKNTDLSPLHIWLVLFLVAIFILERVISEWPNRQIKSGLGE